MAGIRIYPARISRGCTDAGGSLPGNADRVRNVLVAYASKHGSTVEIAEVIADKLRESGLGVDCVPVEYVSDLEPYQAVVLGSAIYLGRWRGDATHFLHTHATELSQRPLWVFSSGPIGDPEEFGDEAWREPNPVLGELEHLGVRDHVVFGGRVPTDPHGPIEHAMAENTPWQYRDLRDWAQIRTWAAKIGEELQRDSVPPDEHIRP